MAQTMQITINRSGLFSLPGEIRNEIYSLIIPSWVSVHPGSCNNQPVPSLAHVNRLIREEVLSLFWSETVFKNIERWQLYGFIDGIGKYGRTKLRHLEIDLGEQILGFRSWKALRCLAELQSLTTLTLRGFVCEDDSYPLRYLPKCLSLGSNEDEALKITLRFYIDNWRDIWTDFIRLLLSRRSLKRVSIVPGSFATPFARRVATCLEEEIAQRMEAYE